MNNYKIIACDMDETLLSSDATICQRNIEAIAKAVAKGVKFVPCTGRSFRTIDGVLKTLRLFEQPDQYVIGLNGGNITEIRAAAPFSGTPFPLTWPIRFFASVLPTASACTSIRGTSSTSPILRRTKKPS